MFTRYLIYPQRPRRLTTFASKVRMVPFVASHAALYMLQNTPMHSASSMVDVRREGHAQRSSFAVSRVTESPSTILM